MYVRLKIILITNILRGNIPYAGAMLMSKNCEAGGYCTITLKLVCWGYAITTISSIFLRSIVNGQVLWSKNGKIDRRRYIYRRKIRKLSPNSNLYRSSINHLIKNCMFYASAGCKLAESDNGMIEDRVKRPFTGNTEGQFSLELVN